MIKLTDELREEFDYVLLDCPAGIEQGFRNAIAGADKAIVVTTPEVSAIRDADRIIGLLEASDLRDIHLRPIRVNPFPVRNRRQKKSTVISAGAFLVRKLRLWNCSKRKAC